MEEFEEYLKSKKIDPILFSQNEPTLWEEFKQLFYVVNPKSFTMQKLFLINKLRRKYHLVTASDITSKPEKKKARPILKKKP
ncbi:MAG: hypothetical protein AAGI07_14330 [Bacteroidota bacterium]